MLPSFPAYTNYTIKKRTPFFRESGVITIAEPRVNIEKIAPFLASFGCGTPQDRGFLDYLDDPDHLIESEQLTKISGQLCYLSLSGKRTWNKDIGTYLDNIKSSGHGSVIEHANFSFLCYGLSRSLTHELVRHRAGAAYSQVSQRYVSGKLLRFVERPEYQNDEVLHTRFMDRIDSAAKEYDEVAQILMDKQKAGDELLSGEKATDLRKKINQVARSVLPNETETAMVCTFNMRALRHIIEMRLSKHAETEIRKFAYKLFLCAKELAPTVFNDYVLEVSEDGLPYVETKYRKV